MLHRFFAWLASAFRWIVPSKRKVEKESTQSAGTTAPFLLQRDGSPVQCVACSSILPYPSILVPSMPKAYSIANSPGLVHWRWGYKDLCFKCARTWVKINSPATLTPPPLVHND